MIACRVAHGRWHGNGLAVATCLLAPLGNRQLGDVAGYAPRFIKGQRLEGSGIARVSVTASNTALAQLVAMRGDPWTAGYVEACAALHEVRLVRMPQ